MLLDNRANVLHADDDGRVLSVDGCVGHSDPSSDTNANTNTGGSQLRKGPESLRVSPNKKQRHQIPIRAEDIKALC